MSKQFVNNVSSVATLATCWHEVPLPPLEGEVPNEREAEGFVRKLSKKTPQSARSGCQLPFQGSQGGFAARVARLATPTSLILLTMRSYIFNSCNRRDTTRMEPYSFRCFDDFRLLFLSRLSILIFGRQISPRDATVCQSAAPVLPPGRRFFMGW